ncbi:hypothetical protein J6590_005936 [Homalodisca vitripennis]|nr:hypothetical protein J6590_005936 [Homalodisca vitripennis]
METFYIHDWKRDLNVGHARCVMVRSVGVMRIWLVRDKNTSNGCNKSMITQRAGHLDLRPSLDSDHPRVHSLRHIIHYLAEVVLRSQNCQEPILDSPSPHFSIADPDPRVFTITHVPTTYR